MSVKRNGCYANGRQRWFCCPCRRSFRWERKDNKKRRERIWFERWIIEGYSVRQLSLQSGHNPARLRRIIKCFLDHPPAQDKGSLEGVKYVVFDGTFLHRPKSVFSLMEAQSNTIISGTYGVNENSKADLKAFFVPLKRRGLSPLSCTTDGNPQVIQMLRSLWPKITIQRCLVHVQRQGLSWCRRFPRRADAKTLRAIFRDVMNIATKDGRDLFLARVAAWESVYGRAIATRRERGRVFSDIKRARSMLLKALPDMFHYLDDRRIPASTNGLEGYFSRLKGHYRHHRGLNPEKRYSYFSWYFKLRPR